MTLESTGEERVLQFEVGDEGGRLRLGLSVASEEAGTLRPVETVAVDPARAACLADRIAAELGRLAALGQPGEDGPGELARLGMALWDLLLGPATRHGLRRGGPGHLRLVLDEQLIHLPWELLHDGEAFLCQRFAMGRIVSTRVGIGAAAGRPLAAPCSLLALANPTGDLPAATRELERIRAAMRVFGERVRLRARAGAVRREYLLENLRQHDIFHYSGHACFDPAAPGRSGLRLSDGLFTAADIAHLGAGGQIMPALVFANGCCSGCADPEEPQLSLYNLSSAFLLMGVRHLVGTVANVGDAAAADFAVRFYEELFQGASVGQAVRRARAATGSGAALAYILYGDPCQAPLAEAHARDVAPAPSARCAACQGEIVSRLKGASRRCEECGLPICTRCWTARGIRVCPAHTAEPAGAPAATRGPAGQPAPTAAERPETNRAPGICGQCGRPMPPGEDDRAKCEVEGCGHPLCGACRRWLDRRACRQHTLARSERLARLRLRVAAGEIPLLVDRETAAQRETLYFAELERRARALRLAALADDKVAPLPETLRTGEDGREALAPLAQLAQPQGIREALPRNAWLEVGLRRTGLLGLRPRSLLRVEILSDLERQVHPGYETEPRGAEAVRQRLRWIGGFKRPDVDGWSVLALASTSGWSEPARTLALGCDGGELRYESRIALVLVDLETDELILPPGSPVGPELTELLRPSPRLALAAQMEHYLRERLQGDLTLTAEEVAEALGVRPTAARTILAALGRGGPFEVREIPKLGLAISLRKSL